MTRPVWQQELLQAIEAHSMLLTAGTLDNPAEVLHDRLQQLAGMKEIVRHLPGMESLQYPLQGQADHLHQRLSRLSDK